jgi:hypothetical protein
MVLSAGHFKEVTNGYEKRTDGLWTHAGKLVLGNGMLDGACLVAGSVQQLIGSYATGTAYTLGVTSVWTETPVQVTATCSGAQCRIEFNVLLGCPTKGARIIWGLMLDGAPPAINLGAVDAPEANYGLMASGCYYYTPAAGSHRFGFGIYGPSGSQIFNAIASTLYVTEQKR